mmetsp:Transcript_23313/g.38858  ORF Transcript_23313/g.38858 Transcript_23313/m.38858 type:complete len:98 (+) Transcript_23313:764-1057(+)
MGIWEYGHGYFLDIFLVSHHFICNKELVRPNTLGNHLLDAFNGFPSSFASSFENGSIPVKLQIGESPGMYRMLYRRSAFFPFLLNCSTPSCVKSSDR